MHYCWLMGQQIWPRMMATAREGLVTHIGRTALELAAEHGLAGTSMSQLAKAAGVARATLYKYFPDVESAIVAYLSAEVDRYRDALTTALAGVGDPFRRLDLYIDHQIEYLNSPAHRSGASQIEAAGLSAAAFARYEAHVAAVRGLVEELLRDGINTGAFRADLDAGLHTTFLLHLMNGARVALDRDGIAPHRVSAALKDLVRRGLLSDSRKPATGSGARRRPAAGKLIEPPS